ncbi:hypothetical protein BD309DRAFT_992136 [Dichomitus squalens]|uniref:Uncharacterized protein n=2 Tax=Dichomitus squalens TaxID=114155 RepID=A0A4Q9NKD6_9APHY|nr:uncharacterized protein DICSQDRAFT_156815 [Dichomitus squalens LYAD-421 SS1]EJF58344.1 hypothetical protein DICSQDRAFT_156815 [Dichomitus squalens LYAD-421 SS1]TBU27957.1 hypothetical protein BD311DRAFT_664374 [Dichomitus squalens]TBU41789.1 hypothetical protein BD309DRAFT_992136 [Dichomitus squalens]TBU60859.1 hypothetical protein BD310DRAFT_814569 [Dichomitus squalens]
MAGNLHASPSGVPVLQQPFDTRRVRSPSRDQRSRPPLTASESRAASTLRAHGRSGDLEPERPRALVTNFSCNVDAAGLYALSVNASRNKRVSVA